MAAISEALGLWDRYIGVHYYNCDQLLTGLEGPDLEARQDLANSRTNELTRGNVLSTKGQAYVRNKIESREKVRDKMKLRDTLLQDKALIAAPFLLGEVPVNGLLHVPYT